MVSGYGIIFLILVSASLYDLWQYRVPNALCIAALTISLFRHFEVQGLSGTLPWLAGIVIPFILCYVLFFCHMLGAGDSKFFSVIGSFVGVSMIWKIMLVSLCFGAVMAVAKMVYCRNGVRRFQKLLYYTGHCVRTRQLLPYYDKETEGDDGVIPFSIAISVATIWCVYC